MPNTIYGTCDKSFVVGDERFAGITNRDRKDLVLIVCHAGMARE